MAGLVPAIHALPEPIVKILPIRVLAADQPDNSGCLLSFVAGFVPAIHAFPHGPT